MRRAAKRDAVESEIVQMLRAGGFSVQPLSLKDGPDLLVGKFGQNYLIEVKTGNKKLRTGQADWHSSWRGHKPIVLRSMNDAYYFVRNGSLP